MTPYQLKQQKRRIFVGIAGALLFHLLLIGVFFLHDLFFVKEISDFSGPVLIKLGKAEGKELPLPEDKTPPQRAEASQKSSEAEARPQKEIPSRPLPQKEISSKEQLAGEKVPFPKPEVPPQIEPTVKVEKASQSDSLSEPEASRNSEAVQAPEVPAPEPEKPTPPQPVVVRGEEAGNSWEYQFSAEQGAVSRSLYAEIYLYMPLPKVIPGSLYSRMTGESYRLGISKQALLRQYYREVNGDWFYEKRPYMDDVRALWAYLIDGGYDQNEADYKAGRNLRPVVIEFTLSTEAELLDAVVKSSSGDGQVDDAVLEGFQTASFSNASGRKIKGRFTYRFD